MEIKPTFLFYLGDQTTNNIILNPSGDITATTFTGALSGNATTATKLQTARTIAGVSFNGTEDISIPFANLSSKPTTLSGYGITDVHTHNNKSILDNISSTNITKWNKGIPFENSYVGNLDAWLTNGYIKTGSNSYGHPPECTGSSVWGVLFFISENETNGTGTQMYYPIDGEYKGRVFTRNILYTVAGEWSLLALAGDKVLTPKVDFGNGFTLEPSGSELVIKFNGVTKQRFLSDGSIVATGELTAFARKYFPIWDGTFEDPEVANILFTNGLIQNGTYSTKEELALIKNNDIFKFPVDYEVEYTSIFVFKYNFI